MEKYNSVKSEFIKDKIKKTKFEDRDYIDDLILLEKVIIGKIKNLGWLGHMKLYGLQSKYKKEYKTIFKELNPKGYAKELAFEKKEIEKEKREEKELEKEMKREEEKERESWMRVGGKG